MTTFHIYEIEQLPNYPFYTFARGYKTAEQARADWRKLNEVSEEEAGRLAIAGMRISPDGTPENGRILIVVGHIRDTVVEASKMVGGTDITDLVPHQMMQAFVLRRVRFMAAADKLNAPTGVYTTSGPLRLNDQGEVVG